MDNKQTQLVSFSDAARLRGVKPQTIDDYVKRGRLKVQCVDDKKFLDKQEVENLKVGKSGRPSKKEAEKVMSMFEVIQRKIENPEKYLDSFFLVLLRLRPILKQMENNETIQRFRDKIFKRNKRQFRLKFRKYERQFRTTTLLNVDVTREMIYTNPKIQMFFEYVLFCPEITRQDFDLDQVFIKFISEFSSEFSWFMNELKIKYGIENDAKSQIKSNISREIFEIELGKSVIVQNLFKGRPISFIDKKGKIQKVKKYISNAIRFWNEGKTGREILDAIFPIENYKSNSRYDNERRKDFRKLKAVLRYHQEKHPEFFTRPFDASRFGRNVWNPKINEN